MEKEIIKTGCRIYDRVVRRDGVDDEGQGSNVFKGQITQANYSGAAEFWPPLWARLASHILWTMRYGMSYGP